MTYETLAPQQAVAHLQPDLWAHVNAQLVGKAIAELAHERLIEPEAIPADGDGDGAGDGDAGEPWTRFRLATERAEIEYRFRARRLALDHWHIDRASIRRLVDGRPAPLEAARFIIDLRDRLGIPPRMLPDYLHELASTLSAAAYKRASRAPTAGELARAGFQEVEAAMSEGHPIFLANAGRIGFNASDYRAYAPEAAAPLPLHWLAARRDRSDFACVQDLSYDALIAEELGAETRARFARHLEERGLDPSVYRLIPVHPWEWRNRLAQLFCTDLVAGDLVYLGPGDDRYQPQQSIRTLFNASRPARRYVKTALAIRNLGFTRGMSATIAKRAAAVNDWVAAIVRGDAYLRRRGFDVLREVAFVGYAHRYYERASSLRSDPYKELLAAQWRENPTTLVGPGRRLITMAALMHRDAEGASLLAALIRASGLSPEAWLRRYLDCYLAPLVHCFYAHRITFTPHCENTILVLDEHGGPAGAFLKDLAEDIGVLNPEAPLPDPVRHLALRVPEEMMTLSIFTDVFDCVFRLLAPILVEQVQLPEARFWQLVAECIAGYEREHPALAAAFGRYDLFAPTFPRNCLNRLQLANHELMVDLNAPDPVASLQFHGTLDNPIAGLAHLRGDAHGRA